MSVLLSLPCSARVRKASHAQRLSRLRSAGLLCRCCPLCLAASLPDSALHALPFALWLLVPDGNAPPFSILISIHHHPPPSSLHSILSILPLLFTSFGRGFESTRRSPPPPTPSHPSCPVDNNNNNNTNSSHSAYHTPQHTTNSYISILVSFVFAASLHLAHPASFHPQHRT